MRQGSIVLILLLLVAGCVAEIAPATQVVCRCTQGIDGDTIEVEIEGQRERVRLMGVDTPELGREGEPCEWYAPQAAAHTRNALESREIRLEFPVPNDRDQYGRLLAYLTLDGRDFCARLLVEGYAKHLSIPPHPRASEYRELEAGARRAGRGLWSREGGADDPPQAGPLGPFVASRNSEVYHRAECPCVRDIAVRNRIYFDSREAAEATGRRPCRVCF